MNFTKDELTLLRHGLDIVCRTEGGGLGQTGLNGLKEGRVEVLAERLRMAASLDARLNEEYAHLDEAEKAEEARKAAEAAVPDRKRRGD